MFRSLPNLQSRLLSGFIFSLHFLPFSFPALHLLFGDGERLAHGIVETFSFGLAGDGRGRYGLHALSITPLTSLGHPSLVSASVPLSVSL